MKTIKELEIGKEKKKIGVFDPRSHITGVLEDALQRETEAGRKGEQPCQYVELSKEVVNKICNKSSPHFIYILCRFSIP